MKALVTGTAGFIGSTLTKKLLGDGHDVVGIDSLTDYYDPARKKANLSGVEGEPSFEWIRESLNDADLPAILDGVEVIYHLAGQPGVRASWGQEFEIYVRENVLATQRLLEATRGSAVRKVVLASSSSIYGDAESYPTKETDLPSPVSPYGVTKLAAEHLAGLYFKGFDVPTVALRYFTIFGPGQRPDMAFTRFIKAASEGTPITVYGDGRQIRDFTFVDDCVAATIAAADRGTPGRVYNIAGGTQATVLDILDVLDELVGHPVDRNHEDAIIGDARRTGADTTRAREELGYEPSVTLAEGIRRQFDSQAT